MATFETPVLIVGGGGFGLATSMFLSNLGVASLLIERHATPSPMPKARYLNQRTMEIFRQQGLADTIYAKALPSGMCPPHAGSPAWVAMVRTTARCFMKWRPLAVAR
jgi:glycine/D-amino acid oxidase-like deaminating enzyme